MTVGNQRPRVELLQPFKRSSGPEVVDLVLLAGLELDDWQQYILLHALGETKDGSWSSPEVGVNVARQNGKGTLLEARELASLFLFRENFTIHSAHQYDTSIEAYLRLKFLVQNTPEFDSRVHSYPGTHGNEGIDLKPYATVSSGPGGLSRGRSPRIRFRTRTKGGGKGFTADCVILDEAQILPEASVAAILPTVSARPNPQVWYTGTAVDQAIHDYGVVLARVRRRGMAGDDSRLAYFEWSLDANTPADVSLEAANDPASWAIANPALGIRIASEYVAGERAALGPRNFAVERLGVGDWPDPDSAVEMVVAPELWDRLESQSAQLQDPVAFAFDVVPDRSSAAIAAAGVSELGRPMVEIAAHEPGVGWVVPWLLARIAEHKPIVLACDATGAAASLLIDLEAHGVEVVTFSAADHARAAGNLYDEIMDEKLTHRGQYELTAAIRGATQRPLGGAWAWNRKTSAVDISPLVAATLALAAYRAKMAAPPKEKRVISLASLPD